jgi:hypothetical protein
MAVSPDAKALELLKFAENLFDNSEAVKFAALGIADEIIKELCGNQKFDWVRLRATGEETVIYWQSVRNEISLTHK